MTRLQRAQLYVATHEKKAKAKADIDAAKKALQIARDAYKKVSAK